MKSHAVFDQAVLMSDINAACAGASEFQIERSAISVPDNVEARLEKLMALKDRNLINASEYSARRKEILASI